MKKIIIVLVIAALIIVGINYFDNDTKNTVSNNVVKTNTISNKTQKASNTIKKNVIENTETKNVVENVIENTVLEETSIKQEKNDDEKAIELVQNEWGADDSVTFKIDEKTEDGTYMISVVDKNTTNVIFWYEVNINTNIVKER